jgi:hypothetical protein
LFASVSFFLTIVLIQVSTQSHIRIQQFDTCHLCSARPPIAAATIDAVCIVLGIVMSLVTLFLLLITTAPFVIPQLRNELPDVASAAQENALAAGPLSNLIDRSPQQDAAV